MKACVLRRVLSFVFYTVGAGCWVYNATFLLAHPVAVMACGLLGLVCAASAVEEAVP